MTHINRGSLYSRTLEETADGELAHIQENRKSISKRRRQ